MEAQPRHDATQLNSTALICASCRFSRGRMPRSTLQPGVEAKAQEQPQQDATQLDCTKGVMSVGAGGQPRQDATQLNSNTKV